MKEDAATTVRHVADAIVALKKTINALCVLTNHLPMPDATKVVFERRFCDAKAALWELADALHACARGPMPANWLDEETP